MLAMRAMMAGSSRAWSLLRTSSEVPYWPSWPGETPTARLLAIQLPLTMTSPMATSEMPLPMGLKPKAGDGAHAGTTGDDGGVFDASFDEEPAEGEEAGLGGGGGGDLELGVAQGAGDGGFAEDAADVDAAGEEVVFEGEFADVAPGVEGAVHEVAAEDAEGEVAGDGDGGVGSEGADGEFGDVTGDAEVHREEDGVIEVEVAGDGGADFEGFDVAVEEAVEVRAGAGALAGATEEADGEDVEGLGGEFADVGAGVDFAEVAGDFDGAEVDAGGVDGADVDEAVAGAGVEVALGGDFEVGAVELSAVEGEVDEFKLAAAGAVGRGELEVAEAEGAFGDFDGDGIAIDVLEDGGAGIRESGAAGDDGEAGERRGAVADFAEGGGGAGVEIDGVKAGPGADGEDGEAGVGGGGVVVVDDVEADEARGDGEAEGADDGEVAVVGRIGGGGGEVDAALADEVAVGRVDAVEGGLGGADVAVGVGRAGDFIGAGGKVGVGGDQAGAGIDAQVLAGVADDAEAVGDGVEVEAETEAAEAAVGIGAVAGVGAERADEGGDGGVRIDGVERAGIGGVLGDGVDEAVGGAVVDADEEFIGCETGDRGRADNEAGVGGIEKEELVRGVQPEDSSGSDARFEGFDDGANGSDGASFHGGLEGLVGGWRLPERARQFQRAATRGVFHLTLSSASSYFLRESDNQPRTGRRPVPYLERRRRASRVSIPAQPRRSDDGSGTTMESMKARLDEMRVA